MNKTNHGIDIDEKVTCIQCKSEYWKCMLSKKNGCNHYYSKNGDIAKTDLCCEVELGIIKIHETESDEELMIIL